MCKFHPVCLSFSVPVGLKLLLHLDGKELHEGWWASWSLVSVLVRVGGGVTERT